jgi:hypothetical protein
MHLVGFYQNKITMHGTRNTKCICIKVKAKVTLKVKQPHYGPGQAQRVPGN